MHIFIDESGSFAPVEAGAHSVSVVGALVVPDHQTKLLFDRYRRLRHGLPKSPGGEVKGKLLNESQVASVCALLRKNNCLFEAVAIDMGYETRTGIEAHRTAQAEAITRHLTDEHQPGMIDAVWGLRRTLEAMPLPLYVQSTVTFEVLARVIGNAPLFYVQRSPKELGSFHWVIDGKQIGKVTVAETWWSQTMLPMLQSRSQREPLPALEDADYSHFDAKFLMETPEYLKAHGFDKARGINLRRLMKDSFRFSSDPEPGLELVDIITNATRRALHGNLAPAGWEQVPCLMVHTEKQYLGLVQLSRSDGQRRLPPYAEVVTGAFARGGREMITPSLFRSIEEGD